MAGPYDRLEEFEPFMDVPPMPLGAGFYPDDLTDWINLKDNDYDIIIGPYEFYEDRLMGVKAAYEATVEIVDREESRNLEVYIQYLDDLERNLPYPEEYKRSIEGLKSPFVVVRDIYRGGDIRVGIQATAANLPNDPRVHTQYGTKNTFWKNMIEASSKHISFAVARELIVPEQRMCQVNYHLESGAVFYDEASARFGVDFDKIASSVAELAERMLLLEATGDYEGAGRFFQKYGQMPEIVSKALARTEHIPVSLEPVYEVLWE